MGDVGIFSGGEANVVAYKSRYVGKGTIGPYWEYQVEMNIRLLEPDVLFAFLPAEPQLQSELALLRKHLSANKPMHLILDFSKIEVIASVSIGGLLLLRQDQADCGARLILCGVSLTTRYIFRIVGLEAVLCYAADKPEALRLLGQWQETQTKV